MSDPAHSVAKQFTRSEIVDRLAFLRRRTAFIRGFYETAAAPFAERKRRIEASEERLAGTPARASGEPALRDELIEAEDSLDLLGRMCISLLSASLQLYLKEVVQDRRLGEPEDDEAARKETAWINRYRIFFTMRLGIDWARSPSDLALLEQLVLAQTRVPHAEQGRSSAAKPSHRNAANVSTSVFANSRLEPEVAVGIDNPDADLLRPVAPKVTRDKLVAALDEVDAFGEWLERSL